MSSTTSANARTRHYGAPGTMRVLYVTAHLPPDFVSGATLQVQRLAANAVAAGHDVAVLAGAIARGLDDGAVEVASHDGVEVHWIGTATRIDQDVEENWRNEHATAAAAALLDHWRPDVVHAHALQTLGVGPLAEAHRRGVPTFLTMHDFWWWCPRLFLVDRRLRPCDPDTRRSDCDCARTAAWRLARAAELATVLDDVGTVLVPSAAMRGLVVANLEGAGGGRPGSHVEVDANDVEASAVARPHATGDVVRFVYVGGDQPLKGRDVVLDAAARLADLPGWTLDLYGMPAATWRQRWRRRRGPVRHHGAYDPSTTAEVLGAADVLVIPSIARESFSIAAREGLLAGLAVVTSDCLGPTEVVHDGVNGLVVPIGDPTALAAAMRSLVTDRAVLAHLRAGATAEPVVARSPRGHAADLLDRYAAALAT